jgi:hypothetical protein
MSKWRCFIRKASKLAEDLPPAKETLAYGALVVGAAWGAFNASPSDWPLLYRGVIPLSLLGLLLVGPYYYWFVLSDSGAARGSPERKEYEHLRESLLAGGSFDRAYTGLLGRALFHVDRFFDGRNRGVPWAVARLLKQPGEGPTWTSASYDRCLLLALIYPFATMLAIWLAFGHLGIAEKALRLREAASAAVRAGGAAAITVAGFVFWRTARATNWKLRLFWNAVAVAVVVAVPVAGTIVVVVALVVALVVAFGFASTYAFAVAYADAYVFAFVGAFAVAYAIAVAYATNVAYVFAGAFAVSNVVAGVVAGGVAVAVLLTFILTVVWLYKNSEDRGRKPLFFCCFTVVMLLACLSGAWLFSPLSTWPDFGPLLAVYGLLTLVNAPFDWFALGLTRFLLRRGLAWEGPWPYFFALIDAVAAAICISLLAVAVVLALQTFGDLAHLRAPESKFLLEPGPLFQALLDNPSATPNWWVWLMLFSTGFPCVGNVFIASFAGLRSVPPLRNWMLGLMPADGPMRRKDRLRLAAALAAQLVLGLLATAIIFHGLIVFAYPRVVQPLGLSIVDFAEQVAAYDAPRRVMELIAGHR